MTEDVGESIVYLDANPFIDFVEGKDYLAKSVASVFERLRARPGIGATSELTLAEVLLKARRPEHRRRFLDLIVWSGVFRLVPVTRDLLIETADYRWVTSWIDNDGKRCFVKPPDAIHVVSAIRTKCRFVLSRDKRLKLPTGIRRVTTSDADIALLVSALA